MMRAVVALDVAVVVALVWPWLVRRFASIGARARGATSAVDPLAGDRASTGALISPPIGGTVDGAAQPAAEPDGALGQRGSALGQSGAGSDGPARDGPAGDGPDAPGPLLSSEVAWALDGVALALEAGLGVVEAIEATATVSTPAVHRALRVVAAAYRWGCPAQVAWSAAGPAWTSTGLLMASSAEAGTAAGDALRESAAQCRDAEGHSAALAAARLSVQVVLPTGLAFLPGFVLTALVPVVVAISGGLL